MMKKSLLCVALLATLMGCEQASQAIDKAQDAANKTVDGLQEQMETIDLSQLNLDNFGEAAKSAEELVASLKETANLENLNPQAIEELQGTISNAYNCLVTATNESTAEKLVNTVLETLNVEQANTFIESSIEKAKEAGECVGF